MWKTLAAAGIAGLPIPEAYGGGGASIIDLCLANEALAEGGGDGGFNLSLGAHWVISEVPIWLHGTEAQKQRWLPGLCDGSLMGAWASTEPEAGSDAGSIRATAVHDGDAWVLNGTQDLHHQRPDRRRLHGAGAHRQGADGVPGRHPHARVLRSAARSTRWAAAPRRPPRSCSPTAGCPTTACSAPRARRCGGSRSSASPGSAR